MEDFQFPTRDDLMNAHERVRPYVHRTPVLSSRLINAIAGKRLFFKCDNFQRMGAFKMRGAANAILRLSAEQRELGVVTHSSGNFAQALALAAAEVGCKAYIVMPENAPSVKKSAVVAYGGIVIESGSTPAAREEKAEEVRRETGATFIHPSDNLDVIVGNSTLVKEFVEDAPGLNAIIVPVGGGGLIAGSALAARHFAPGVRVFGAEPSGADDAYRSLRDGRIYPSIDPQTICDGLRTNLGRWNFPIIRQLVDEILLVDDTETIRAMRLIWERMKIVVEPSAAITLACVLKYPDKFPQATGLVMCGGNVDLEAVSDWFRSVN